MLCFLFLWRLEALGKKRGQFWRGVEGKGELSLTGDFCGLQAVLFSCIIGSWHSCQRYKKGVIFLITTKKTREKRSGTRRLFAALFAAVFLLSALAVSASAASVEYPTGSVPTEVYLDGELILAGDTVIYRSVTYVPLRKFCNLFDGCSFSWDGKTQTATVKTESGMTLVVRQGAVYLYANGRYLYTVEAVQNWSGSLYVPIRPLARAFDVPLSWNASRRAVELQSPTGAPMISYANYNADDLYWLSRIISAEARGESMEGQIAVGNVVLNRVRHASYPNTIYGVIFDRKHGTQFSPVSYGTIYQTPAESSVIAAKICLEGYSISDTALFFMNPRIATSNWISKNRPYAFTIGNHDFYN